MRRTSLRRLVPLSLLAFAVAVTPASGQGGGATSSLSGVVVDTSGAVIPGADVTLKNEATGTTFAAVSSDEGTFTIPAIPPGTYTATVTLMGFKTASVPNVKLNAGTPGSIRVSLEVGALEETVVVTGGSEIVQTQVSTVSTTLDINNIQALPTTRNALDFIASLPGVNTPAGIRDSTINGLPQSAINITIDGMNVQDNYLKTSDGFFTRVSPRTDAVEEVTVTTAAQGADSAGQGAAQIRFVTRSGTNRFRGSAYYYLRHDALNANTWFNNRDLPPDPATGKAPKPAQRQHQPGFRLGGPIVIPGLWDGHNRGFFFVNYEEFREPRRVTRDRRVLSPDAQQGIFRYSAGGQIRSVNLFDLARRNGQLAAPDPSVASVLAAINGATASTGQLDPLADPNVLRYTFQNEAKAHNRYPTFRLDFDLAQNHRLSGSYNYQKIFSDPDTLNNRDPNFPGLPARGVQDSVRYAVQGGLRSTLASNVINELRIGGTGGATKFAPDFGATMWDNQGGFSLNFNGACCGTGLALTNAGPGPTPSSREASTKVVEDTLNWVTGSHSLSFGASWTQVDLWLRNQTLVPTINFGIVTGDPADAMFTTANFAGASTTNLNNARAIYSILTGRVRSITGNAGLDDNGDYVYLGERLQEGRMREFGVFAQDSWRVRRDLTLNFGLRYELQLPFYPLNDSYSTATVADVWGVSGVGNLFEPGVLEGQKPTFQEFRKGSRAFNIDWNNVAPNFGFAWTPHAEGGFVGKLLGMTDGDTVVRGGYAIAYNRGGMSDFSGVYGANPGVTITVDRDQSQGNLGPLPLLLRDPTRLGPPAFPESRLYPMSDVVTGDVTIFDPNLQTPYAQSWTFGVQRKITSDIAIEARYLGTRHLQGWHEFDYNELNVLENGFLDEFKVAQRNLQANIAAGRGANFRYFGPGTGTSPLPIILAHFSGLPASQAGNPGAYTSANFASATFLNPLAMFNPNPCCSTANANPSFAWSLINNSTLRGNAARAGLAPNFFLVNPDLLGGAIIVGNGETTRYDSLQLELRKRMSRGIQFQASYVYGKAEESQRYSFRKPFTMQRQAGTIGGVTHAFKGNWVFELPFGRGRRFGGNAGPLLDRLIGGWEFDGVIRLQTGQLVEFGNVRLVGMNEDEFRKLFDLRFGEDGELYMLPQDIIDNTVRAFGVSATSPTGYGALGPPSGRYLAPANSLDCVEIAPGSGDCGVRSLVVPGPMLWRADLSVVKRVPIRGPLNFEFRAEMFNAFNHPYFYPVTGMTQFTNDTNLNDEDINGNPIGNNADTFRIIEGQTGREVQLVMRISW